MRCVTQERHSEVRWSTSTPWRRAEAYAVVKLPPRLGGYDVSTMESTPTAKAATLLENLRRTPMSMGGRLTENRRILRGHIERTIEDRGVPARLAERIARQLVFKFDTAALGDRSTCRAVGELLRREAERLQAQLGLVERQ